MTITIPREALEKAARAIAEMNCPPDLFDQCEAAGGCMCRAEARAACLAMLKNWPGMRIDKMLHEEKPKSIILPLTENSNER